MIYAYSLAFNLVSETEQAVRLLYEQNDERDFKHYIIDLGFPLLKGDEIPDNIENAKRINTERLKSLAGDYGSLYLKMDNIGVSQNTGNFYRHIKPQDEDILCSVEPDEIQNEGGWIRAQADVLRADKTLGYVAPILVDAIPQLINNPLAPIEVIAGYNVMIIKGNINYGQVAYSGAFLNKIGGVPFLPQMQVYGGIEAALKHEIDKLGMRWGILKDYTTIHTNVPQLYRKWKDYIIFVTAGKPQIKFEEWLQRKKNGEI